MNKSIILTIEELKHNLINTINQANVEPYFLEPVMRDLYLEIKDAAQRQVENEFKEYSNSMSENAKQVEPTMTDTEIVEEDKNDEDPK